jgi:DNA-binding transcriptional LysR family regulator
MDNNLPALNELHVFAAVADHRSFTAAARQLGSSTAAVSRVIRRLEARLGGRLLHRTTRSVGLTDLGESLHRRTRASIGVLEAALRDVGAEQSALPGKVRITCAHTFGRHFVAPALVDFRILYPEIEVDLQLDDEIADLVTSGANIAIRGGHPRDERVLSRHLAPLPLYTCAAPALLRRHRPTAPADFLQLPCIAFRFRRTREMLAWEFVDSGEHTVLHVPGGLVVDDFDVALEAALGAVGFAQLPGYVALPAIRAGRLVPVLPQTVRASRSFTINWLRRSAQQPVRERLLLEHLLLQAKDPAQFSLTKDELTKWSQRP